MVTQTEEKSSRANDVLVDRTRRGTSASGVIDRDMTSKGAAIRGKKPLKVAILSSGLGNTKRGFEISAARWFDALRAYTNLDVELFCGGNHEGAKRLWNFPRNGVWLSPIQHVPFTSEQHRAEVMYGIEQISFWSALNFELIRWKPDVIWVKDVPLAHLLMISRVWFGLKFKLMIANGGMLKPQTYKHFDLIQQISLKAYEQALRAGVPAGRMELISNCIPQNYQAVTGGTWRERLGLAADDWIVTCVAAWNIYHKRIDYLIQEIAAIDDPKVKLILCGAPEVETPRLKEMGERLLGDRVHWLTVEPHEVAQVLSDSNAFVLPSLRESLGNVLLEAALTGVPIITHPHDGALYAIEDDYWMTDLSVAGNLASRLRELRLNPPSVERLADLRKRVQKRFGAESLARQFENAVEKIVFG